MNREGSHKGSKGHVWKSHSAVTVLRLAASMVIALLLLWLTLDGILVIFAGVLFAVFLQGLSGWVSAHTPIPEKVALPTVLLVLLLLIGAGIWFAAPNIGQQFSDLADTIPRSVEHLKEWVGQSEFGSRVLERFEGRDGLAGRGGEVLGTATGVLSSTIGVIGSFIVFFFIGLFLASQPDLYKRGVVKLVPISRRERADEVMVRLGAKLRGWLIGKMISMVVIGVLTAVGLTLLGIPLAISLGVIAALFTFIPNIGPVISAIPAVLLALMESPSLALYVILLYVGTQTVETYILTPIVQQKTVSLPPALTLSSQVILGIIAGGLGLVLATPLALIGMVLVQMLYVEDALGDRPRSEQRAGGEAEGETGMNRPTADRLSPGLSPRHEGSGSLESSH